MRIVPVKTPQKATNTQATALPKRELNHRRHPLTGITPDHRVLVLENGHLTPLLLT